MKPSERSAPDVPPDDAAALAQARALFQRVRSTDDWSDPQRARAWRELHAKIQPAQRGARALQWLAAGSCVAALLLLVTFRGEAEAGDVQLEAAPQARFTRTATPSGEQVTLSQGRLEGRATRRARVVTPQVEIELGRSRFAVEVREGVSSVFVSEGSVEVRRPGCASVSVGAGERLHSDAPQLDVGCAAAASTFAAQNELFARAVAAQRPAEALDLLRQYQQRFPHGAFAPEAELATVRALLALGRTPEALEEARRLRRDHGTDVALLEALERLIAEK